MDYSLVVYVLETCQDVQGVLDELVLVRNRCQLLNYLLVEVIGAIAVFHEQDKVFLTLCIIKELDHIVMFQL